VELFPNDGLSKVITGYLSSGISRFPLSEKPKDAPDLSEGGVALGNDEPLSQEDCLVLMTVSSQHILFKLSLTDLIIGRHSGNTAICISALLAWRFLSPSGRVRECS
jgi:hypothetical protein